MPVPRILESFKDTRLPQSPNDDPAKHQASNQADSSAENRQPSGSCGEPEAAGQEACESLCTERGGQGAEEPE